MSVIHCVSLIDISARIIFLLHARHCW